VDWPSAADNTAATAYNTAVAADSASSWPSVSVADTSGNMDATDSTIPEPFDAVFAVDIHECSAPIAVLVVAAEAVAVELGNSSFDSVAEVDVVAVHWTPPMVDWVHRVPSRWILTEHDSSHFVDFENSDDSSTESLEVQEVLAVPEVVAVSFEAIKWAMSLFAWYSPSDAFAVRSCSVEMDPEPLIQQIESECSVPSLFEDDIGSFDSVHFDSYCFGSLDWDHLVYFAYSD